MGEPNNDAKDVALAKINDIRNSIIGCQTVNWSEHVYPLVAALEDAGIEGAGYPESRAYVGTMLERTLAAEAENERLRTALQYVVDWHGTRDNHEKLLPPDQQNDEIRLAMLALGGKADA